MTPDELKAALNAATPEERKYVLAPYLSAGAEQDFPVEPDDVDQAVEKAIADGRIGSLRYRGYEFGLLKSALAK